MNGGIPHWMHSFLFTQFSGSKKCLWNLNRKVGGVPLPHWPALTPMFPGLLVAEILNGLPWWLSVKTLPAMWEI